MTICERMFSLLEEKGKSAYGLCKILGIDTGLASAWKRRGTDPPAKYLPEICSYLGTSISYLVTGSEDLRQSYTGFDEQEIRLVEKYRTLDEDGKDAVRGVLLQEQRRVQDIQKKNAM